MRILVTGSRDWEDSDIISDALEPFLRGQGVRDNVFIHGDAQGADTLADTIVRGRAGRVEAYPADWAKHGRRAGVIRNAEMLKTGVDLVLAFILRTSRPGELTIFTPGTLDMIRRAREVGLPCIIHELPAPEPAPEGDPDATILPQ